MKYETYKLLTTEEKEEYNFKFGQKPLLNVVGLYNSVSLFCLVIVLLTLAYLLSTKDGALANIKPQLEYIFGYIAKIIRVMLFAIMIYAIALAVDIGVFYTREFIWIRKRLIKKGKGKKNDA